MHPRGQRIQNPLKTVVLLRAPRSDTLATVDLRLPVVLVPLQDLQRFPVGQLLRLGDPLLLLREKVVPADGLEVFRAVRVVGWTRAVGGSSGVLDVLVGWTRQLRRSSSWGRMGSCSIAVRVFIAVRVGIVGRSQRALGAGGLPCPVVLER
jgi:hypothetical protein